MPSVKTIDVALNRVEGDLEVRVEMEDGVVADAWSSGTMFRGFERVLVGRGALDGLVITPRICGICTTAHLAAAAAALDRIVAAVHPPDAVRVRNVASMVEHLQSDVRHGFLMFAVDFVNPAYQANALFDEAVRRYAPCKGETAIEVIRETKKLLEIIMVFGGQWPHSSYMVPGGVTSIPTTNDLLQCRHILSLYRSWYERRILGCPIDRWREVKSAADLEAWLDENDAHRTSDLGFYIRFAREVGLDRIGRGPAHFISYGSLEMPENTQVRGRGNGDRLVPPGFAVGTEVRPFEQEKVAEHVVHSWFENYEGGRHPFEGETRPCASIERGEKYSWAKAPRYDGLPAETGPLAEMVLAGSPLFTDLADNGGPSVFVRELARLVRGAELIPAMETWLSEMEPGGNFYVNPGEIVDGEGVGLTHAARGALGHWVRVADRKIEHYQIITPTAWNASPRDSEGRRGPWEEALIGTPVRDVTNPVELGHVVRSFDACLVCTVHTIRRGKSLAQKTFGGLM